MTMPKHEVAQHVKHGWEQVDTSHIRNVDYLHTHNLMKCECGFYGWVSK